MPFDGIESPNAMATIWMFVDYKYQAIEILQKLSHRSRAYIWNSNGLRGFLITRTDVASILEQAQEDGSLEDINAWHNIDYD